VNAPAVEAARGGRGLTFVVALLAMLLFGLVGGLPDLGGPVVAAVGLVGASYLRRSPLLGSTYGPVPALLALLAIAVTAPPVPSAALFGGLATLAVLLWLADDPARPAGGGRRATLPLASCGLAVGIAWALVLGVPRLSREVGLAGGLLAAVLLVLAYLLTRHAEDRPASSARS